jgi:outer membrane protein assembly factor BamB
MQTMRLLIALYFAIAGTLFADNWPQWRGPHGTGVCDETNLPVQWSTNQNVRWRVRLPDRGNSTPVIWGNRVFVTQAIESTGTQRTLTEVLPHRRTLMCFDRANGKLVWQKGIDVKEREPTHPTNPYCSASPVTDGERVIVSYGAAGLYAYDFKGKELWHRDLGPQKHIWGNAASPVIYHDLCILNYGPGERQFLIAVDKKTGKTIWQVDEPGGLTGDKKTTPDKPTWVGSWSTPIVVTIEGRDELLMSFPSRLASLDPTTGKERWTCGGLTPLVYTSPIYSDGIAVAMAGFSGSSIAVKTGGDGDVTASHRVWHVLKNRQRIGSGVISGDYIYIHEDPGVAQCIELKTGKVVWDERLAGKGVKSDSWSSMVLAGDKLYSLNQGGDTFVLRASPKFELLNTNSLGETSMSSVAPSNGELFIRTYKSLWCIGPKR